MATITKRGRSYKITVSCGYDQSGKQIRPSFTWTPPPGMTAKKEEKELQRQAVLFEEQVKAGTVQDGNIRFQAFAEMWMKEHADKNLKIKTYTEYKGLLKRINQAIGHIKISELRTGHLNSFYSNLQEDGIRANNVKATAKSGMKKIITKKKLSFASLGKVSGVSSSTVSAAYKGETISLKSAEKIAEALNVKTSDIFSIKKNATPLSATTVRAYHRLISSMLSKAVKWGYISHNPAANAELPKLETKEAPHLDEADARLLLELLQPEPIKYRAMITFALLSGLRRGELLGLRWSDVDFLSETITIVQTSAYVPETGVYTDTPKNRTSNRPLKLSRTTFLMLQEYKKWQEEQRVACGDFWKDEDGRVFTADDGAPIYPGSLTEWFTEFVKNSKLPKVTVHSLRHTYASLMIADGTPLVVVSRRLGHAQVSTTANIYAHVIASADEKAAQITEKFADVVMPSQTPAKKKITA